MVQGFISYMQDVWAGPLPGQLIRAILVAAVFELLAFVVGRAIRHSLRGALRADAGREPAERIRRRRIVEGLPLAGARAVLYLIALLMILRIFGLQTGAEVIPVLAALVVVALVVFRDALRDAARGYMIAYDALYAPGDRVTIGELTGLVTDLSLRATRLRTGEGREVVIPNARVGQVTNLTRGEAAAARAGSEAQ